MGKAFLGAGDEEVLMAQVLSLSGTGGSRRHSLPPKLPPEGPSRYLAWIARADAAEAPLAVEFVGLTESEQRAAINAFPGGKRFLLVTRPH